MIGEVMNINLERYTGARLAVANEAACCGYAVYAQHKKLIEGIDHAQKSISVASPVLKSFHRLKALQKLQEVAMQDIYPKGRRYAAYLLTLLNAL
jgi:glutathione peroxidase-family protein